MHMDSLALGYIVLPLYTHTSLLNFVLVFTQTSYHGFSKWLKSPHVKESKTESWILNTMPWIPDRLPATESGFFVRGILIMDSNHY